jgi:exodeoxyribonuclease VII large subunit
VEQLALGWEPERRLYTVRSLTAELRGLVAERFDDIWVAGEISGAKLAASGHYYFTLKDQEAQLRCACFRQVARYLKFKPQDGIQVLARGRIDVYEARGEYQLLVEALEPQGVGALQLAFEQLKKKLAAEGLFEAARKRPLPRIPRRIGIVTSPTGAVIRDLLNILGRRFPGLHIRLYPAQVQGAGSIDQVVAGIEYFSRSGWPEVVIVARGGGSLEDLWTFNEEAVARAIAGCSVPVVSAVGHETDFTIADFVADLRAPTPSAAAELVVPTRDSLVEQLAARRGKLEQALRYRLSRAALRLEQQGLGRITAAIRRSIGRAMQRVDERDERLRGFDPRLRLAAAHRRLDAAGAGAGRLIALRLARASARLDEFDAHLRQLSPLAVLERGYALVEDAQGMLLRAAAEAPEGSDIGVRLAKGRLTARVTSSTPA